MKKVFAAFIFLSTVLVLASCGVVKTDVTFWVAPFYWTDDSEVNHYLNSVKILGTFNDWAGSTTDLATTWANSDELVYNAEAERFEFTTSLEKGDDVEYTLMVQFTVGDTDELDGPYWQDPSILHNSSGTYFLGPFDGFVDNGMGNGGHNAIYEVP